MIARMMTAYRPRLCAASVLTVTLVAAALVAAAPSTRPSYVRARDFDLKTILGDPPADDSVEHQQEIDHMLDLQAHRTPDEEARCKDEEAVTVFAFGTVLGEGFNEKNLPKTAAMMRTVYDDTKDVSGAAKLIWRRVRPPLAEPRIKPCVALEHTASYPSGHSVRGVVWATLLADIFPDQRDALLARGRQIGDDRALAGMHYPSDVVAGQKLGAEIAKRILDDPVARADLQQVKAECLANLRPAK